MMAPAKGRVVAAVASDTRGERQSERGISNRERDGLKSPPLPPSSFQAPPSCLSLPEAVISPEPAAAEEESCITEEENAMVVGSHCAAIVGLDPGAAVAVRAVVRPVSAASPEPAAAEEESCITDEENAMVVVSHYAAIVGLDLGAVRRLLFVRVATAP
ncbi:hypothetical protein PIB30_078664 [Stylosanthes scabra]|uniref:Uncharacterized protein n=1 Tax=Stylosanthes scabra TaxID=79078 RepID=A0ABU6XNW3_9FABA|nr:hypothetical protein [Stylosanthes scabra]